VQLDQIEVTRENLVFQGLPAELPIELDEIPSELRVRYGLPPRGEALELPQQEFEYCGAAKRLPKGVDSALSLESMIVSAHDPTESLEFVRKLQLVIDPPGSCDGPPSTLFKYDASKSSGHTHQTIEVAMGKRGFVLEPLELQASTFALRVWVDPEKVPRHPWAVDVSIVLSGAVNFEY
jgi:hypothetical protein